MESLFGKRSALSSFHAVVAERWPSPRHPSTLVENPAAMNPRWAKPTIRDSTALRRIGVRAQ
jgi:hypothetical protein